MKKELIRYLIATGIPIGIVLLIVFAVKTWGPEIILIAPFAFIAGIMVLCVIVWLKEEVVDPICNWWEEEHPKRW